MTSRIRVTLLAAVLLAAFGCDRDALAPGRAAGLRPVDGDAQVALPGATLPRPLSVRVEDAAGRPASGAVVQWRVAMGDGALDLERTTAGSDGVASVSWTLGPATGEQRVEASLAGGSPAVFSATATDVAELALSPRHVRLRGPGDEMVLRLTTRDAADADVSSGVVTWESSDPAVATVIGGRVHAVGKGAAVVTARGDVLGDTVLVSVAAAANEPVVATGWARQPFTVDQVILGGTTTGNGLAGRAWLEWGRAADLSDAARVGLDTMFATTTRNLSATVGPVSPGGVIYYRVVGQNAQATTSSPTASYTVAPPEPATGLHYELTSTTLLLRLYWTPGAHTGRYAIERREPGQSDWTSTPLYYSSAGGFWTEYPKLDNARNVEYRIRTCNPLGCAVSEAIQAAIPRFEPPQNLTATLDSAGRATLTWTDVSPETWFRVYRRMDGGGDPAAPIGVVSRNATTFRDTTHLLAGLTYVYSVVGELDYGHRVSSPSNEASVRHGDGETYPPIATMGRAAQLTSVSSVTIYGYANGNGFAGHRWLEWSLDPSMANATPVARDTLPATGNWPISRTLNGFMLGTTIYYRAVAQNRYGTVRSAVASYTVGPPQVPAGLAVTYGAPAYRTRLTWTPSVGTATWSVQSRSSLDSTWVTSAPVTSAGGSWLDYPDLTNTRTAEYRVRACDAVGCVVSSSVFLPLDRLEPPTGLTAAENASHDVVLSWTGHSRDTGYEVFRRKPGEADGQPLAALGTTGTFTDTSAVAGETYVYHLRAVLTPGRHSVFGDEVTITPAPGTSHPPTATTGTAIQPIASQGGAPDRATLRGTAYGDSYAGHTWFEWSTSPDLSGAAVVGRDTLPATGTKTMQFVLTGLSTGSTVYFRAVAQNRFATTRGAIASYTLGPPAAPTGLGVQYGAPQYLVKLAWTPGERTVGYAVQQRVQGTTAWTSTPTYTSSIGGAWSQYPTLTTTRTVEYRVQSCNGAGCAYSDLVSQLLTGLEAPQNLHASVNLLHQVVLTWSDGPAETAYEVSRCSTPTSTGCTYLTMLGKDATTYTDTRAQSGVSWTYSVNAYTSYGSRRGPASKVTVTP